MMQTYATPLQAIFASLALTLACMNASWAQSELIVSGTLRNEDTKAKLAEVEVSVLQNGEPFDEITADRNGRYFLELPMGQDYTIVFGTAGMVSKRVQINSSGTPEGVLEEGFMFDLDMSLFDNVEGFDTSILDTPIGIASFDDRSERIQFDLDHTNDMRRRIDRELDRLANLEEDLERAQMRYDNAMEDAARAEARERWEDAYEEFEKALSFIPGDERAQAGMDRMGRALGALAQAEEDAQRALDEAAAEEAAALAAEEAAAAALLAEEAAAADAAARAEEAAARQAEAASRAEEAAAREAEAEVEASQPDAPEEQEAPEEEVEAEPVVNVPEPQVVPEEREDNSVALLEATEAEWKRKQDQLEADRKARQAQAQARAKNWSQRASNAEDEAEAYYRKALESERQATAADVQDVKDGQMIQSERWKAEAAGRARNARKEMMSLDNGTRTALARDIDLPYEGREAEHRRKRTASWDELESFKRANQTRQNNQAQAVKNRGQSALMEMDLKVAASKERGFDLSLPPEDRDIPQGVHETSYEIQNGLVIMRTVRDGDVVQRYRKVVMKTGTYYFCGDQSITKDRWMLETNLSFD